MVGDTPKISDFGSAYHISQNPCDVRLYDLLNCIVKGDIMLYEYKLIMKYSKSGEVRGCEMEAQEFLSSSYARNGIPPQKQFSVDMRTLTKYIEKDSVYSVGIMIITIFCGYKETLSMFKKWANNNRVYVVKIPDEIARNNTLRYIVSQCITPYQRRIKLSVLISYLTMLLTQVEI